MLKQKQKLFPDGGINKSSSWDRDGNLISRQQTSHSNSKVLAAAIGSSFLENIAQFSSPAALPPRNYKQLMSNQTLPFCFFVQLNRASKIRGISEAAGRDMLPTSHISGFNWHAIGESVFHKILASLAIPSLVAWKM